MPDGSVVRAGIDERTKKEAAAGLEKIGLTISDGSLDGVQTGVRQLRRSRPLETTVMHVGEHDVTLPTLPEVLLN